MHGAKSSPQDKNARFQPEFRDFSLADQYRATGTFAKLLKNTLKSCGFTKIR